MVYHWAIAAAVFVASVNVFLAFETVYGTLIAIALGVWFPLCGALAHARPRAGLPIAKVTHACLAVLMGLFSIGSLGLAVLGIVGLFLGEQNSMARSIDWAAICVGALCAPLFGLLAVGSRWTMRRFAAAARGQRPESIDSGNSQDLEELVRDLPPRSS